MMLKTCVLYLLFFLKNDHIQFYCLLLITKFHYKAGLSSYRKLSVVLEHAVFLFCEHFISSSLSDSFSNL